jgi:D-beta-D-heptose 7-phosphate kinase / D-beta-D-heptose 1-phosphate adenosyltransferase
MIKIPSFKKAKVLVIGDIILDRYFKGPIHRISPEAPVPILNVNETEERLGGAANVAYNIKTLGAQATLLGVTGKDQKAERISQLLKDNQIQAHLIQCAQPTICKTRIISNQQQLLRLDVEEKYQINSDELTQTYQKLISKQNIIVLSDYAKGTLPNPQLLIEIAKQHKIPVLVDPKSKDFSHYQKAFLITPNMKEFEAIVGECKKEEEIIERGMNLLEQHQFAHLLITRGIDGMLLLSKNEAPFQLPALAQEVFDVTGAGDTVIATLAASLASNADLKTALTLSNTAAGISVKKHGTSTVSPRELRQEIQKQSTEQQWLSDKASILSSIADAKLNKEKIVMTNGCFDILHPGHIASLEEAKKMGDRLVVAINDDASVARLKGKDRPIHTLEHRMKVLLGLKSTDWIISFSEDTPLNLIKEIQPDILVKGGDYKEEEIVGADFIKSYGGKIKIIPLIPDCSTTKSVQKIAESI